MPDVRAYPLVDATALFWQASTGCRIPSNRSEAILRATTFLALICLVFGASCAVLIPASPEQRLGSFVPFRLRARRLLSCKRLHCHPGFLAVTSKVCAWVATQCFRFAARLLCWSGYLLIASTAGIAALLPLVWNELQSFSQSAFASLSSYLLASRCGGLPLRVLDDT